MKTHSREEIQEEYNELKKKGFHYLQRGVVFLIICLVVAQLVESLSIPYTRLFSESALIAGWVALWRPIEIFLYELHELKQQLKSSPASHEAGETSA